MTSYNRVILTGRVVRTPERHYRPDGSPVIQFPLELNDSNERSGQVLNRSGSEQAPHHDGTGQGGRGLINIVAFGKIAEFKLDLLQRGQHLLVVGRLNQRHWQTPEGKNRTRTEVIATDLRPMDETDRTSDLSVRGDEDEKTC
jgi:single-strand DNA-binding protein